VVLDKTQTQYQLVRNSQGSLTLEERAVPVPAPAANSVLVRVRATSLNRRDLMIRDGQYPVSKPSGLVPLSDGAGEIVAVGPGVSSDRVGERVAGIFFQNWQRDRPPANHHAFALGGAVDGMLSQYVTLPANGVVSIPEHLSFEEAATLPCAAVTAWQALVERCQVRAGDFVLLQGTGGVSIFGLQFAAALGAKSIITSSSDAKLETARKLGAVATINYKSDAAWGDKVRAITGGIGAQAVLEVGGGLTIPPSLASLATGGSVAIVGGLSSWDGTLPAVQLLGLSATVHGITVGSREHFEQMNAFISKHRIHPIIDRVFEYAAAPSAYAYLAGGEHFGKVVIRLP
jgi:NADPH:quinone reductase-like Zn-dependent oxidoreductase